MRAVLRLLVRPVGASAVIEVLADLLLPGGDYTNPDFGRGYGQTRAVAVEEASSET